MVLGSPLFYECIFISDKDWIEWSFDGYIRDTNYPSSFQAEQKSTFHVRSQAINEIWISQSQILNHVLQFEQRNPSFRNISHLNKHHIFSETYQCAALEDCEFEGTLWDKMPILVQPYFWFEFEAVGTPDGVPMTHGVWVASHLSSFAYDSLVI